jgi:MoaA/NifB/PqqE/SkfB family radical SAM enzyme
MNDFEDTIAKDLLLDMKPAELVDLIQSHLLQRWRANNLMGIIPSVYSQPLGVQLEITYRCNLRCYHCYNESGISSVEKYQEELSEKQWLDIAEELAEIGIFSVIISGGEPFYNVPLVLRMAEVFSNAKIKMGIVTNGWFLNDEVIEKVTEFRKAISWIQVSIDAADKTLHDSIRGVRGSFDRCVRAIIHLRENAIPVKMSSVIMQENEDQLERLFELALFLGVEIIHVGNIINIGSARKTYSPNNVREARIRKMVALKEKYSKQMEVMISIDACLATQLYCKHRLNNVYIIRPNGDLKLDCVVPVIFGKYQNRGDLTNLWTKSGLDKAYENETVHQVIASIARDDGFQNISDVHLNS